MARVRQVVADRDHDHDHDHDHEHDRDHDHDHDHDHVTIRCAPGTTKDFKKILNGRAHFSIVLGSRPAPTRSNIPGWSGTGDHAALRRGGTGPMSAPGSEGPGASSRPRSWRQTPAWCCCRMGCNVDAARSVQNACRRRRRARWQAHKHTLPIAWALGRHQSQLTPTRSTSAAQMVLLAIRAVAAMHCARSPPVPSMGVVLPQSECNSSIVVRACVCARMHAVVHTGTGRVNGRLNWHVDHGAAS